MNQLLPSLPDVTLEQPMLLWLILLALPLVALVPRGRLSSTPWLLSGAILSLRLLIVGLAIVALAEPALRPPGRARSVVFALDVSDSQAPDQRLWARAWVERAARALPPGSQWRTIEFAERAQLASQPGAAMPPGTSTDVQAALRLATALVSRDSDMAPEIVLLTDGWATAAESAAEAASRACEGVVRRAAAHHASAAGGRAARRGCARRARRRAGRSRRRHASRDRGRCSAAGMDRRPTGGRRASASRTRRHAPDHQRADRGRRLRACSSGAPGG